MTNNIKTVQGWMKDVSTALGTELKLNDEGLCAFQAGEDTVIVIEVSQDTSMLHLYSPLIKFPEDTTEATTLIMRALELNVFQTLTRGGAIAAQPGGGALIFCFSNPIEGMDAVKFSMMLGGFFETVGEIRNLLVHNDANKINEKLKNKESASLKYKA